MYNGDKLLPAGRRRQKEVAQMELMEALRPVVADEEQTLRRFMGNRAPVSYTHLDVYKRQLLPL